MTVPSTAFSDSQLLLTLVFLLIAPLAIAGVALMNTGMGRSRSASQALLGCIAIFSVGMVVFAVVGASFAGEAGSAGFSLGGKPWNWIGLGPLLLHGFGSSLPAQQMGLVFEFLAVGFVGMLPWGAGADRLRLTGGIAVAAILGLLFFPLFAHWAWGGGWLGQLGENFGLGAGFLDGSGAGAVHVLGGLAALAMIWVVGPRKGKFPKEGLATAMPAHHTVYVLFGCLLALVGWLGWNAAGAILWLHAAPAALAITALNTLLAAAGALLATFVVTRFRFGKPDASLCANGWLGGLVTSSACAGMVTPGEALFVGAVAGVFTPLLVEVLELALSIDDPSGAISVHAACGLWGLFAAGLFAPQHGQLMAQLIGIATLLGLVFPALCLVFALLDRMVPFRVDPDGERLGMDLHELGGGAYPEFVIHRDDSYR